MPQKERRKDQRQITRAPDPGELGRRAPRLGPVGVEQEELAQHQPRRHKACDQHWQACGLYQSQNHRDGRQGQGVKPALARFTVQIAAGVADHDPADECDQKRHGRADRIQSHQRCAAQSQDHWAGKPKLGKPAKPKAEGGEGRCFRQHRQAAGSATGPCKEQRRRHQQQQGGKGNQGNGCHDRLRCWDRVRGCSL